jgi:hypothetical protein
MYDTNTSNAHTNSAAAFIIPLGIMVNYGDIQFVERIMVARRSEMSAEWKVMFAICIAFNFVFK